MLLRSTLFFFAFILSSVIAVCQPPPVPVPCTNGTQNTCKCNTSPVLCTADQLDGYTYSMTNYLHASDGPYNNGGFMCPGAGNTTSHNPTWFKFPAWCEDLELEVCATNCNKHPTLCPGGGCSGCCAKGIQSAVYSECFGCPPPDCYGPSWAGPIPFTYAVGCDVSNCIGCNGPDGNCATVTMTGLEIGKLYYFLVDGCCGSACDIEINVLSPPCPPIIDEFIEIDGPTYVCAGGDPVTYFHPRPDGANMLHWFIDGVEVQVGSGGPARFFTTTWTTPGEYELCFDASQNPCIVVDDNPPPTCITVIVYDITVEDVEGFVCPGETFIYNNQQFLPGVHLFEFETDQGCDSTITLTVIELEEPEVDLGVFEICQGETIEVGGQEYGQPGSYSVTLQQEFEPYCDSTVLFEIVVFDADPGGLNVDSPVCPEDTSSISVTGFNNNPDFEQYIIIVNDQGVIVAIISGGTGQFTYDDCGEFTVYSLNFHPLNGYELPEVGDEFDESACDDGCCEFVSEPLIFQDEQAPTFVSPPDNITLICLLELDTVPNLAYNDNCIPSGTVAGEQEGDANLCEGGTLTRTWFIEDVCGNSAEHVQTITIEAYPEFEFVDAPDDITIVCDSIPATVPPLIVTNNVQGICAKTDTVPGVLTGSADLCGGELTATWTYTDTCDRTIVHVQVITVEPAPLSEWQNPPPSMTIQCADIPTTAPPLVISNGLTGECGILDTVPGMMTGMADLCGGEITFTWEYTDVCGTTFDYEQVLTVDPVQEAQFVNPPGNQTVECANIPTSAPPLDYTNGLSGACLIAGTANAVQTGSADLCGGVITFTWSFTDVCGRETEYVQTITANPVPQATFQNPPPSVTVDCANIPTSAPNLDYTNGLSGACLIAGTATPTQSGSADLCGGTITFTWSFTDVCGRQTEHVQTVTVNPVPAAQFVNPPQSMTIECADIPTSHPPLAYENGQSGACAIMGSVDPVVTGSADLCGGTITRTWTFTDVCGRTIEHVQNITVTPVPQAQFVSPPQNITVQCADIPTSAPSLDYTNGLTGACAIAGTVPAVTSGSANLCGGTITNTWTFTDVCGRTITHTQTITVQPVPQADFVNPPQNITVDCYNIPTSAPPLTYTNGLTGNCLISGTANATQSGSADLCGGTITFTWTFTDQCGRSRTHTQTVTVTPVPVPAFVNPPPNQTVSCQNIPTSAPPLTFTNGETGACAISGQVNAVMSGSANLCGGVIQFTWTYTDPCGRTIQHIQTVIVQQVPAAQFVNPPQNMTVTCEQIPSGAPQLSFTNGLTGACAIEGTVAATQTGGADLCGGTITYTWNYTDQCGRIIQHVQVVTVTPTPIGTFQNPPPNLSVDCSNIPLNPPNLTLTNGVGGNCGIFASVPPQQNGNPNPCGGSFNYTWSFTDVCGRTQTHVQTITVSQTPIASFQNTPNDITVTCTNVDPNPPSLNYTNNQSGFCAISGSVNGNQTGFYDECGGTLQNTWSFTDNCNRTITHVQTVTVLPAPPAVFETPLPADITVTCDNIPGPDQFINYTNNLSGNCVIQGAILPTQTIEYDACGGNLTFEWEFTDNCNRQITHQQHVTILPANPPEFVGAPEDVTIECWEVDLLEVSPLLSYSNYQFGDCENSGAVFGIQDPNFDECGGTISYTWILDACGVPVQHTQMMTVLPAANPQIESPPADLTLECGEPYPLQPELYYFNNQFGFCEIEGFITPEISEVNNVQTTVWNFIHPCTGEVLTQTRVITGKPVPNMGVNPDTARICLGESFNLGSIQIVDINNAFPNITFHSASPATPANEITNLVVSPTTNTTYVILGTTQFGCSAETTFFLYVDSPVTAGGDGGGYLCYGASGINLFDYLAPPYDTPGTWVDPNNSGVDIFPPTNVSFVGATPGVYTFWYVVAANGACSADTAVVTLTLVPQILINITGVICQPSLEFYNVNFTVNNFTPVVSIGTLTSLGGGAYSVTDIPVDQPLTITVTDPASGCSNQLSLNPPNCDCPDVPPPVSLGNHVICVGDPIPALQVTVGADEQADWYDAPSGGNLLASNTTSYTPNVMNPGIYTFYVEAVNTDFPECKSNVRTPIILDIRAAPTVTNGVLKSCDPDNDGLATFTLSLANPQVNGNPNNTFAYFATMADAQAGTNQLPNSYTNTVPNQQIVFVSVTNVSGCKSIAEVTLIVFPTIVLNLNVTHESCQGAGDGGVTISSTGGTGQVLYSLTNSNFNSQTVYSNMNPGTYTAYARDTFGCLVSQNFVINQGLVLDITQFTVVCDANGTPSDDTDDFYTVTFTVENTQGNVGTFMVTGPGINQGPFNYGQSYSFTIPANGQSLTLTFSDVVNGCPQTRNIGPLNPCSTDCLLTITELVKVCNDNGTNADPSDDFYEFSVNATAINPGVSGTFQVFVDGVLVGTFPYGVGGTFTLPADGSNPQILFVDSDDAQCSASQSAGALITCSNTCVLSAVVDSILCDNMDTGNNSDDDVFTFQLTVNGLNTSGTWYFSGNPGTTFTYGAVQNMGPYLILDGPFTLTMVDSGDPNCTVTVNIQPPPPCSEPCDLEVGNLDIGPCNDNNTGPIEDDDFYQVTFTVTSINSTITQYIVQYGGFIWGPFDYGATAVIDGLPANGQQLTLFIVDVNNPQCQTSVIVSQDPCSSCNVSADAGPDFQFDCLITSAILQGSASPTGGSFQWNGPNNFQSTITTPLVNFPGTYVLTVTWPDLCTAVDSAVITIDPTVPSAHAGPNRVLTCYSDSVLLDGSLSSDGPDEIYIWSDANNNTIGTTKQIWVTQPGTYFLQVIDLVKNCASPISQVVVTEDRELPIAEIMADPAELINCVIENVLLFTNPQNNVVYTWEQNTNQVTGLQIIINQPGMVTLTAVDTTNGCSASRQLFIEDQTEYPIVNVLPPGTLNCRDTEVVIDASQSQSGTNIIFLWFDPNGDTILNATGKLLTVTQIGQYTLEVRDTMNGCANEQTVEVFGDYDFPEIDAGPTVLLPCDVYTTDLFAVVFNEGPQPQYNWTSTQGIILSGGNSLNPYVEGSAWYFVQVMNTENGCSAIDSVFVQGNADEPRPTLEIDPVTCKGEEDGSIRITNIVNGEPPYTVSLNGSVRNDGNFSPLGPGTYYLEIVDVNNCTYDTTIVLQEGTELILNLSVNSILVIEGDSAIIEAIVNVPPSQIRLIEWTPGIFLSCDSCLITRITPLNTQEYRVTVEDINGCKARDFLLVVVKKETKVYIPNAFSPDGNIINDRFILYGDDKVKEIKLMRIYDRWGGLMFEAQNIPPNDPSFGWDGTTRGMPVELGVYVYYFEVEFTDGRIETFKGDVNVITKIR